MEGWAFSPLAAVFLAAWLQRQVNLGVRPTHAPGEAKFDPSAMLSSPASIAIRHDLWLNRALRIHRRDGSIGNNVRSTQKLAGSTFGGG